MTTYELVAERVSHLAPCTNFYSLDDGRFLMVTVPVDDMPVQTELIGFMSTIKIAEVVPGRTEVYLCDEYGTLIDGDGDPSNGMTPLAVFPAGTTHVDALAAFLGDAEA